jgi:predicted metal-dependent hydrolase
MPSTVPDQDRAPAIQADRAKPDYAKAGPATPVASDVALKRAMRYLNGYPASLRERAQNMIVRGEAGPWLAKRYPQQHQVQTDKALFAFANEIRQNFMRQAPLLNKVLYDSKLDIIAHALGLHTAISRVQGGRLVAKKEIRIASLFKGIAPEFLQMIVVHELAHLREMNHDKAFYRLCESMQPDYHQVEFDLRLLLAHREAPPVDAADDESAKRDGAGREPPPA